MEYSISRVKFLIIFNLCSHLLECVVVCVVGWSQFAFQSTQISFIHFPSDKQLISIEL